MMAEMTPRGAVAKWEDLRGENPEVEAKVEDGGGCGWRRQMWKIEVDLDREGEGGRSR